MGRFEKQEKPATKAGRILRKWLIIFLIAGLGLAVAKLTGLAEWLETRTTRLESETVYCIGLVVIFAACEAFSVIHSMIRKRKEAEK